MKKFFKDMFADDNNLNEKNFVGVVSFFVMVFFAVADIATGAFGIELVVTDFIYNSFVLLVLGCFGISGIEGIMNSKKGKNGPEEN